MNRTQRKLFAWFFVLLFALVAPTVVLFAQGYRFSLENNIFIYSGSITIKSWPRDVEIFIDGDKQEEKSLSIINGTHTINGIKPGKYRLTCSKPGFVTWEKDIEVHSGISTEFWNVILFPEDSSDNMSNFESPAETEQIFLSPNSNDELVLFSKDKNKNQIHLLDTGGNSNQLIFETEEYAFTPKEEGLNIEWSVDNKRILLPVIDKDEERRYLLIEVTEKDELPTPLVLDEFLEGESIKQARWMFNQDDEIIILTKDNNLLSLNYEKEEVQEIAENVSGFDFAEYSIFYSQLPNNIVWKTKQNNLEDKEQITTEPLILEEENKFVKITAYDEYRIFINSSEKSFLHNEDKRENTITTLKPTEEILGVQFSNDGKKLLCWNDHEVWYYMLRDWKIQPKRSSGEKVTVTRSSEIIKNVQWMDNYENIIISTADQVKSIEADPRSYTNVANLAKTKDSVQDKDLIYNKNNQTLYLLDQNKIKSLNAINSSGFLGFQR